MPSARQVLTASRLKIPKSYFEYFFSTMIPRANLFYFFWANWMANLSAFSTAISPLSDRLQQPLPPAQPARTSDRHFGTSEPDRPLYGAPGARGGDASARARAASLHHHRAQSVIGDPDDTGHAATGPCDRSLSLGLAEELVLFARPASWPKPAASHAEAFKLVVHAATLPPPHRLYQPHQPALTGLGQLGTQGSDSRDQVSATPQLSRQLTLGSAELSRQVGHLLTQLG